jgi:coenzyme PQQ synthesis protein D (PqqD)
MNPTLPFARRESLIVKDLPEETLVYDLETDKALCLNLTAARVWKSCNGKRSLAQLRELLEKETGSPVLEDVVWLALDQLETFGLLEVNLARPQRFAGLSRRQILRTAALTAAAIPIITSIIAPTPAQAASCGAPSGRDNDCPCTSSSQCTSGCCRGSTGTCKSGGGGCI